MDFSTMYDIIDVYSCMYDSVGHFDVIFSSNITSIFDCINGCSFHCKLAFLFSFYITFQLTSVLSSSMLNLPNALKFHCIISIQLLYLFSKIEFNTICHICTFMWYLKFASSNLHPTYVYIWTDMSHLKIAFAILAATYVTFAFSNSIFAQKNLYILQQICTYLIIHYKF